VRFELILVVTTGAQQQWRLACEIRAHSCGHNRGTAAVAIGEEVGPIDQAFIGYPKRSKEKAVKVNRLESPSREGRSASESRARPM
jgi:hypothetical protein